MGRLLSLAGSAETRRVQSNVKLVWDDQTRIVLLNLTGSTETHKSNLLVDRVL